MTLGRRAFWCAYAILLGVAVLPILSSGVPPLFDYPNHLARMHVLAEGGDRFYQVAWRPLPNLAEDLVVPPLARLLPLALAGRLFLVACLGLLAVGPALLARVIWGSWSAWSLGSFLVLYNRSFLWGFLNYLFGLGVAFCGVALWLSLAGRPWWLRLGVGLLTATLCFFCHIEAFGCYGVLLLGFEIGPAALRRDWRRAVLALAQFLPAGLLFVFSNLGSASGGAWNYGDFRRKADLLFSVLDNYHRPFDAACFALLLLLLIGLAIVRRLEFDRRGLLALGLLFATYLLLPSQLFSGSGADHRLPPAIFMLIFAVARPRLPRSGLVWLGSGLLAMFVVRTALIEQIWLRADTTYAADIAIIDRLPRGATVAVAYPDSALNMVSIPELHMPLLAVVRRDDFVPTIFAYASQQPIRLTPAATAAPNPDSLQRAITSDHPDRELAGYDYAILVGAGPAGTRADSCFQPIAGTQTFHLYKIVQPACSVSPAN